MKNIEENNKLIAKFLGLIETNVKDVWGTTEYLSKNINSTLICSVPVTEDLYFHNSWDCLMPVVEKIESLKIKDYSIRIVIDTNKIYISVTHFAKGGIWNTCISKLNKKYFTNNKLEILYIAVIEFINWYNEQNNN